MKLFWITIPVLLLSFRTPTQDTDYGKIFGSDYVWAVKWLKDNSAVIEKYASQYHIPSRQLKAIVFPELIRYNKVFDAIEVESLKYLYVSEGRTYADFSVGYFQMKPSFAERVEKDRQGLFPGAGQDNENGRRERVIRLTNVSQQIVYLCAFYKICEKKFQAAKFGTVAEKLKFFATCYNSGYHLSYEHLLRLQTKKHFYKYNYSDISLHYFLRQSI